MKISVLNLLLLLLQLLLLLLLLLLRLLLPPLLQLLLLHDAFSHPNLGHGHGAVQHHDHNAAVRHGDSLLVVVSLVTFVMDSLEYKYITKQYLTCKILYLISQTQVKEILAQEIIFASMSSSRIDVVNHCVRVFALLFLARATEGTSLYVSLCQSVR